MQVLAACGYEATGACVHQEPAVAGMGAGAGANQVNGGGGGVRWGQLVGKGSRENGVLEAGPSVSAAGRADGSGAGTGGGQTLASGSGSGHAALPRVNPPFSLMPANYALYTQPTLYQAATTQVPSNLLFFDISQNTVHRKTRSVVQVACAQLQPMWYVCGKDGTPYVNYVHPLQLQALAFAAAAKYQQQQQQTAHAAQTVAASQTQLHMLPPGALVQGVGMSGAPRAAPKKPSVNAAVQTDPSYRCAPNALI